MSIIWREPIFDRTLNDVHYAIAQLESRKQSISNGLSVTTDDLKGCLNLSDLNRIEGNIEYLSTILTSYGYEVENDSKQWTREDLPTTEDMERIADNIKALVACFTGYDSFVTIPNNIISHEDINNLEYNLHLLKQLLDGMESSFLSSGTQTSGSTTQLPLRR